MPENRPIKKRILFGIRMELKSPLCVSSGEDFYTDSDVQRNFEGEVFIPGTSIAGAMRGYLERKEDENNMFGYSDGDKGKMSPVWISDMYFDSKNEAKTVIRDGVRLKNKIVDGDGKFEMEAVDTGITGTFRIELVIREATKEEQWLNELKEILGAIQRGDICFGANKNRGFGRMKITELYQKIFESQDRKEWIDFKNQDLFEKGNQVSLLEAFFANNEKKYKTITIPLILKGGISIRKYSTKPGNVDYEHITSNRLPVIPGTSWNGAIRARALEILRQLQRGDEKDIEEMFGYVDETKNEAQQSLVRIAESIIKGGKFLEMTRNKINRFDASTIEGALYSERAYFGGETKLEIKIKYEDDRDDWKIGLLLLVIKDIQNGYLPVGGQTAVGRGIFAKGERAIEIDGKSEIDESAYFEALLKKRG